MSDTNITQSAFRAVMMLCEILLMLAAMIFAAGAPLWFALLQCSTAIRKLYDDIVFSDEKVVVATRLRELLNGIYDE